MVKNGNHKSTAHKAASMLMSAAMVSTMAFPVVSTLPVFAADEDVNVVATDDKKNTSDNLASLLVEDVNDVSSATDAVECPFVVSILQNEMDGVLATRQGDEITYDVTIRNASDKAVSQVVMYMALPDGMDYVDSEITQDNCAGQNATFDKASVSWGKGARLLTIRPGSSVNEDTPTMKAGSTLSFSLTGKVTAESGTNLSTKLSMQCDAGADGDEILKYESDEVTATVEKTKKCLVNFDANEGVPVDALTVNEGKTVDTLPETTRSGYDFAGWFTEKDGGDKVTKVENIKDDMTLYAHWTDKKIEKLTLNKHELTVKSGDDLGLTCEYEPGDVLNAEFVWTSSDDTVMTVDMKDGKPVFQYKGVGTVTLTVSTKDGSLSDSCKVTVQKEESRDDNENNKEDDKNYGNGKIDTDNTNTNNTNTGNNDGNGNNSNSETSTPTPSPTPTEKPEEDEPSENTSENTSSEDSEEATTEQYVLNVVLSDGTTKKVTVKDNVELNNLVQTLGFTNVSSYKYRTASNNTETSMDTTTTMKTIAEMAEKEEVLIIGYDSSGNAVGCGKVTKTGEGTYTVTLSKDTSVALNSNDENDKGKGEGEDDTSGTPVSKDGKGDAEAAPVKTADSNVLQIYGGLATLTAGLMGLLYCIRRKIGL